MEVNKWSDIGRNKKDVRKSLKIVIIRLHNSTSKKL